MKRKGGARDADDIDGIGEDSGVSTADDKAAVFTSINKLQQDAARPAMLRAHHRASLPDSLDHTSLLSQPIHHHQHQNHPSSAYVPVGGQNGSHQASPFLPNLPPSMSMPPGNAPGSGSANLSSHANVGSSWPGAGHGRRNSLSTPPDHMLPSMPRPMTADAHPHAHAPFHALPHHHQQHQIYASHTPSGASQSMSPFPPNGAIYGGSGGNLPGASFSRSSSSSSFAMPPYPQQNHLTHPSHVLSIIPPTSNHSASAPVSSVSSGGTTLSSRPGTDDRTASSSTAGDTPLLASSLSSNPTPNGSSGGESSLGDLLATGFLPGGADFHASATSVGGGAMAGLPTANGFAPPMGGPNPSSLKTMPAAATANTSGFIGGAVAPTMPGILGFGGQAAYQTQDERHRFDLQYPSATTQQQKGLQMPATAQSFLPAPTAAVREGGGKSESGGAGTTFA
ncbi:hypothetical protein BDZ90DRAFT_131187 [Jaminaea rosea]|uniref:Uncharacterized protein n=1 Tax=Jaminaea rosea TaxID=1569628 RepID=A0A316UUX2_9BASI|nr:hypothetical protein BDZ90DRAFT_131187 [Jaminaea rosea]PWN28794.1 hypothetical protein BDZ90DRAFT_131187 [Jaminaea rosea]